MNKFKYEDHMITKHLGMIEEDDYILDYIDTLPDGEKTKVLKALDKNGKSAYLHFVDRYNYLWMIIKFNAEGDSGLGAFYTQRDIGTFLTMINTFVPKSEAEAVKQLVYNNLPKEEVKLLKEKF